ncbi:hypothetical protein [Luteimonas saliphila]|uniref:hypothetical protein n=1 Tax=Luteimonas saliphila TaxID=2804919 RepID=UPI00192D3979|nr:hypothetical protein [Luteimonas saliphila]
MTKTARILLIGAEDLLGIALLGIAGVVLVETLLASPETREPIGAFGCVLFAVALSASVLFFVAANNLFKTKIVRPRLHLAAVVFAFLIPSLGLMRAHI